jgi:hypothetical protein
MGIIFQNGFGLGTAPDNVVGNIWDPQYKSSGLAIYPNILTELADGFYNGITAYNSSISDVYAPGTYGALAKTAIHTGDKYMITFGLDFDLESTDPNYWLGFGTRSIDLENYLGSNDNSVGIGNNGAVYYGGTTIFTSLPTFGTVGDIIDVAIDGNNKMWFRVNGGDWNGDNTANPATNSGGLNISSLFGGATLYPAIALFGGSGPSVFSVYDSSIYGLPSGFTQIAGDRPGATFTITSSMFNGSAWYNSICGNNGEWSNGLSGFTVNQAASNLYCGVNAQLTTYASIDAAFTAVGAALDWHGYVCSVNWGPGSTISNGYAKVAYDQNNHSISISTIDTTDVDYLINNSNSNDGTSLAGTFNFPATFTILAPLIDKGGWC